MRAALRAALFVTVLVSGSEPPALLALTALLLHELARILWRSPA